MYETFCLYYLDVHVSVYEITNFKKCCAHKISIETQHLSWSLGVDKKSVWTQYFSSVTGTQDMFNYYIFFISNRKSAGSIFLAPAEI